MLAFFNIHKNVLFQICRYVYKFNPSSHQNFVDNFPYSDSSYLLSFIHLRNSVGGMRAGKQNRILFASNFHLLAVSILLFSVSKSKHNFNVSYCVGVFLMTQQSDG
jgi:hypothetical protein